MDILTLSTDITDITHTLHLFVNTQLHYDSFKKQLNLYVLDIITQEYAKKFLKKYKPTANVSVYLAVSKKPYDLIYFSSKLKTNDAIIQFNAYVDQAHLTNKTKLLIKGHTFSSEIMIMNAIFKGFGSNNIYAADSAYNYLFSIQKQLAKLKLQVPVMGICGNNYMPVPLLYTGNEELYHKILKNIKTEHNYEDSDTDLMLLLSSLIFNNKEDIYCLSFNDAFNGPIYHKKKGSVIIPCTPTIALESDAFTLALYATIELIKDFNI